MSEPVEPLECLAQVFMAVTWRRSSLASDEALFWFYKGLMRAGRENMSLDEALGLSGPGCRHLGTRLRQLRRGELLSQAVEAVSLDDELSEWARCKRLAGEVAKLNRSLGRMGAMVDPPSDWPACRKLLFEAAKFGPGLPSTAQGLSYAVKQYRGYALGGGAAKMLANYL